MALRETLKYQQIVKKLTQSLNTAHISFNPSHRSPIGCWLQVSIQAE
jgi:hypothetical protein